MSNFNSNPFQQIEQLVLAEGGVLCGAASIKEIKGGFHLEPASILEGLDYAVSVAVKLNKEILKTNISSPSLLYKHHYRQANMLLDRIALKIAGLIEASGYRAIPIPASIIIDWKKESGHLSHKEIAYLAGLGWRGKNNLLVNQQYGCSIRLASVLTDLVLKTSPHTYAIGVGGEGSCGACTACQAFCPVGAIKDSPEEFERKACSGKVREFSRRVGVGICGLCLGHCPERT